MTAAPARPDKPPTICTTPLPAKSTTPTPNRRESTGRKDDAQPVPDQIPARAATASHAHWCKCIAASASNLDMSSPTTSRATQSTMLSVGRWREKLQAWRHDQKAVVRGVVRHGTRRVTPVRMQSNAQAERTVNDDRVHPRGEQHGVGEVALEFAALCHSSADNGGSCRRKLQNEESGKPTCHTYANVLA